MKNRYSIEEVFNLIGEESLQPFERVSKNMKKGSDLIIDGYKVHPMSLRYILFKHKGCTCVKCGRVGTHFKLDGGCQPGEPEDRRHFNLYTDDDILITKDHIVPKRWGGEDTLSNMQVMCEICNKEKGSNFEGFVEGIVATRVSNPEDKRYYRNLSEAVHDFCSRNHIYNKKVKNKMLVYKVVSYIERLQSALENHTPFSDFYWTRETFIPNNEVAE